MTVGHHDRRHHGRRAVSDRERGVTIVEAVFAVPVFLLLVLGLVDLGSAVLQSSQTSSGAADGARAATVIRDLTGAETAGPAHDQIVAAARARLVGSGGEDATVTISCHLPSGSTYTCGTEGSLRDRAQIKVEVSWDYEPVSFVGAALPIETITGTATMGLMVLPLDMGSGTTSTTTTAPLP